MRAFLYLLCFIGFIFSVVMFEIHIYQNFKQSIRDIIDLKKKIKDDEDNFMKGD